MYIDSIKDKYPEKLLENSLIIEGNVIACLWKNPFDFFSNYNQIVVNDFLTQEGQIYFSLAQELYKEGYKIFDIVCVSNYLNGKKQLEEWFNNNGGFRAIEEMISLIDLQNTEVYIENLTKRNILINLYDLKLLNIDKLDDFIKMPVNVLEDWYLYQLSNIFIKQQLRGVEQIDLTKQDGYKDFIKRCNEGRNLGVSIASSGAKILNYNLGGLHKGCMHLIGATSGEGKSTILIPLVILPLLEQGEKIVLLINEEDEDAWRSRLLVTVVNWKTSYHKLTRQRFQEGNFTGEELKAIDEATEWLNKYSGNLMFVKLSDYKVGTMKRIITKYHALGFDNIILDTMKPESETSDASWALFTENSKELFQMCNKYQLRLICTIQLGISVTHGVRYLTRANIARARSIIEVAGVCLLFRRLRADEYTGENYDCKPFYYIKDENGHYTKSKRYLELDKTKEYIIKFIDKNRYGKDHFCILYERNLAFNILNEVGFCTIREDY